MLSRTEGGVELRLATGSASFPRGLGLAVAYESARHTLFGVRDVLAEGLLVARIEDEPDVSDLDGDRHTDRLVKIAWLAPTGRWAGDSRGAPLATIRFLDSSPDLAARAAWLHVVPLLRDPRNTFETALAWQVAPDLTEMLRNGVENDGAPTPRNVISTLSRSSTPRAPAALAGVPAACSLDVDGDGRLDPLTDGILVLRHLMGVTGVELVANVIGPSAVRKTSDQVSAFLGSSPCDAMLDVDGSGGPDALTDGILVARSLFGISGSGLVEGALALTSTRTTPEAVRGFLTFYRSPNAALELQAPATAASFLSGVPVTLAPEVFYSGSASPVFVLRRKPAGMTIDEATGRLSWTAPASAEGTTATVEVFGTDGDASGSVTFTLPVARPTPVTTSVSGTTVAVTQAGTLQGFKVTLPPGARSSLTSADSALAPSDIGVGTLSTADAPPIPSDLLALTEVFRVTGVNSGREPIQIGLPKLTLPAGRSLTEVRLYIYTDVVLDAPDVAWRGTQQGFRVAQDGSASVQLHSLGPAFFIGLPRAPSPLGVGALDSSVRTTASQGALAARCEQETFLGLALSDHWACFLPGLRVNIKDYQRLLDATGVPYYLSNRPSREEIAQWLYDGYLKALSLGLTPGSEFDVQIEHPNGNGRSFVLPISALAGTLHIVAGKCGASCNPSDVRTDSYRALKFTVLHEYFHHAQMRTQPSRNVGDFVSSGWALEGTAQWFPDEVYDNENLYQIYPATIQSVLRPGLDASYFYIEEGGDRNPYQRFAFWKYVNERCRGFRWGDYLSGALGYEGLRSAVESGSAECKFGNYFGPENTGKLETALVSYQLKTQGQNVQKKHPYYLKGLHALAYYEGEYNNFAQDTNGIPNLSAAYPRQSSKVVTMPASLGATMSAATFVVDRHTIAASVDEEVVLRVDSTSDIFGYIGRSLWVLVSSSDAQFADDDSSWGPTKSIADDVNDFNDHVWKKIDLSNDTLRLRTRTPTGGTHEIPRLLINVVQARAGTPAFVNVILEKRKRTDFTLAIDSPSSSAQVSQRTGAIIGTIGESLGAVASTVKVTFDSLAGLEVIANRTGNRFTAKGFFKIGDNQIRAQAYDAAGLPVGPEATTFVTGIEGDTSDPDALRASAIRAILVWTAPTGDTDVDLYGRNPAGKYVWYNEKEVPGVGRLSGQTETATGGPEYLDFFAPAASGTHSFDVYFFEGGASVSGDLVVVLNEGIPNMRFRRLASFRLTNPGGHPGENPGGTGPAWAKDLIQVDCDAATQLCTFK